MTRLQILTVFGATSLFLVLALGSVLTKQPIADEGWFASPPLNFITNGSMGTQVLEPSGTSSRRLPGIHEHTYWVGPLYLVIQVPWYRVFGFGLFSMRALSVLWGLIALLAWYFIMLKLSEERKVALLAFTFIALDYIFIMHAALGRMDIMSAALGFSGIAAYLTWREKNLALAVLLSQALVVASGLTHPNGIMPCLGVLFLALRFDSKRLRWSHFAIAIIPYLVGALGWGLYVLGSFDDFKVQMTENASGRATFLSAPLIAIKQEFTNKYLEAYGFAPNAAGVTHLKIFIPLAFLVGIVGAISSREIRVRRGYQALLVLMLVYFLIETFFNHKLALYLVHITPFYAASLAIWIRHCWERQLVKRWLVALFVSGFLSLQVGAVAYRIKQNDYAHKYLPVINFLRQQSSDSGLTFGSAELAFGIGFTHLMDDLRLGYYTGKRPDYIVVDPTYRELFASMKVREPHVYQYINVMLNEQCRVLRDDNSYSIYDCREKPVQQAAHG
jgi:4-amino-4-deoxy-L-arabinose transferase-like glycosyltransferase